MTMKRRFLEALKKISSNAAKRADGRASEFGLHQPKRPDKKKKK